MTDNRVSVYYNFNQYGITKDELMDCFYMINSRYSFEIRDEENIIEWWGIMTRLDESPYLSFTPCDIPTVEEINAIYPLYLEKQNINKLKPRNIYDIITTKTKELKIVTCPEGNACVTIPIGSNSVASTIDSTKMENKTLVNNNEYINQVANLPIYKYNITGQPSTSLRIAPTGNDWNNVFNFESKDPTKQNIELMDMIGVMLSCIQNLNARIAQLENN